MENENIESRVAINSLLKIEDINVALHIFPGRCVMKRWKACEWWEGDMKKRNTALGLVLS